MEVKTPAWVAYFLPHFLCMWLVFACLNLIGCAASNTSRGAAEDIDNTYQNSSDYIHDIGRDNATDSYENSTQTTKGVLIGGAAGAVAGGLTSGVGALPGAAGGAVFGGILGAYIDRQTNIFDQLENRGVKVFVLGDNIMMVLPSPRIFENMTPNIKYQAYSTLDLVAVVINSYTTMLVKVGAYTNESNLPPEINSAISQQQADSIVRYLWPRVNTRLLTGTGYGACHLVAKDSKYWGHGDNYRVEISLEKLPV